MSEIEVVQQNVNRSLNDYMCPPMPRASRDKPRASRNKPRASRDKLRASRDKPRASRNSRAYLVYLYSFSIFCFNKTYKRLIDIN